MSALIMSEVRMIESGQLFRVRQENLLVLAPSDADSSSATQGSEKPRIRLRCPSRSTFSLAPRKLLLVDFGRKEYGYGTSWRGS